jgi:hypothetical protein
MIRYANEMEKLIEFLRSAADDNRTYISAVEEKEKEITDLEHELELGASDAKARARVSHELQLVLRERRKYKNIVECTAPIAEHLKSTPKLLNELGVVLGKIRKVERYHDTRHYVPRQRTDLTIGINTKVMKKED